MSASSPSTRSQAHTSEETSFPWYAIYTRSRHERTVQDNLRSKGYDSFSPICKVRRRRGTRTVDADLPIFSSYVFCRFDAQRRLPILTTPGVVAIVSRAGEPAPIDSREVTSLQALVRSDRILQPWDFLLTGQKVRIVAGSMAGAEGVLVRVKNRVRLVATVTVLQRAVAVEIDQDMVEPIY